MGLARWLQTRWFQAGFCLSLSCLLPLWLIFVPLAALRRLAFRQGWLQRIQLPTPVIVIGNLTVGGAGKTPLTLALLHSLRQHGWQPGIVSRGYGARPDCSGVRAVNSHTPVHECGDEPLLLARRGQCPVWVGQDRAAAALALLAQHPEVNLILCDDGLQHYRLARSIEIAVFDTRGIGNGWQLPLGPLREPISRLSAVDAIVLNGNAPLALPLNVPAFSMQLAPAPFYRLTSPEQYAAPAALAGKRLHAIAGIGHPERFFQTLRTLGLDFIPHPFPDHHTYQADELDFGDDSVLLMTEKDAVKCTGIVPGEAWVLPINADVAPALTNLIVEKLRGYQTT